MIKILALVDVRTIPRLGDRGPDVLSLQVQLISKGQKITLDGVFGAQTKAAVSAIQKAAGLAGSGIIGPKTMEILELQLQSEAPVVLPPTKPDQPVLPITKDCKRSKANTRKLHHEMRMYLEKKLFSVSIPQAFLDRDWRRMAIMVVKAFEGIKEEGGNNRGYYVGLLQSTIGADTLTGDGAAWCMSTMQTLIAFLEDYLQEESPVPASELCTYVMNHAKKVPGLWFTGTPEIASIIIWQNGTTIYGHTGLVRDYKAGAKTMQTSEGNTGSGNNRDGDGFYPRVRSITMLDDDTFVRGFVRIYPDKAA
jgi:hypothetical protein